MKIIRFDSISEAGGDYNLDLANHMGQIFWIMDGATALVAPYTQNAVIDIQQMLQLIDEIIRSEISKGETDLLAILQKAAIYVKQEIVDTRRRKQWEIPSTCIGIVQLAQDSIKYFVLGDVVLAIKLNDKTMVICDEAVKRLDNKAITQKLFLQRLGLSTSDARQAILPVLRQHRSLMNTSNGYWIFNGNPEALKHAMTGEVPIEKDSSFILATDGFSRLIDTFYVFPDWTDIFDELRRKSLAELVHLLREIESKDSECLKYPRFSPHDDATALYIELSKE